MEQVKICGEISRNWQCVVLSTSLTAHWRDLLCLAGIVDRVLTQWCADSCIVGSLPTRDGPLCAVSMLLCVVLGFAVLPGVLMYVSYMGELTVWIVFPTVAIRKYRSSPLVLMDSCMTAAACLSSACSFAVSQASDLALLVGYAA